MPTLADKLHHLAWPKALLGMLLTGILALSVHVVMLQVLHVPYPDGNPSTGWPVFLGLTLTTLALTYLYRLAHDEFARFSVPVRCLLLFALTAMLREALIRIPIMDSVATTAWRYSLVAALPRLSIVLILASLVVLSAPRLSHLWQKLLAALLIGAFLTFLCLPLINRAFAHVLSSIAYLNHDAIYNPPYDWHIEVPAYITYIEPVVACFLMVALVWDRLSPSLLTRTAQFTLLILAIANRLISPITYAVFSALRPAVAVLSMGQFVLEALTLALLTTVTWRLAQKPTPTPATAD